MTHDLLKKLLRSCWIAVAATVMALLVRYFFLGALEHRVVWVTFYPMVVVASVYGGIAAGMLSTGLACAAAYFLWPLFASRPFIDGSADWLGVAAFVVNCLLIAAVAESMRRAKSRAEEARIEAEKANRAKSSFLATMSHELRTPLNAIIGFAELMRHDDTTTGAQHNAFATIHTSGSHLLSLINDVLDMARIESGKMVVEPHSCKLDSLLHDVDAMVRLRAESKRLAFSISPSPDLPQYLVCDEAKVRQILINLLGNAIKFTESGSVTLRVQTRSDSKDKMLVFEVEDTGVGIPEAEQKRIFKPFEQVDAGRTKQEGTGLGLAISWQYAQLLQGNLTVRSVAGSGSIFTLALPFTDLSADADTISESEAQLVVSGYEEGQPVYRVLIVEDEPANWQLLKQLMERIGLTVQVAHNGLEAISLFESWQPDFIWMDCRMPVMDGFEATRRIRQLPGGAAVSIFALTASVFKQDQEMIAQAGMSGFLQKPINFNELYQVLEKQLGLQLKRTASARQHPDKSAAEPLTDSQHDDQGAQDTKVPPVHILAVDDTPATLALLSTILESHGYLVTTAASAELALQQLATEIPDLLLLDIRMPGMDGFELCSRIKSDPQFSMLPVIFMSACDETSLQIAGFDKGAVDFVIKPFEPAVLLARVQAHAERYRLKQELLHNLQQLKTAYADLTSAQQLLLQQEKLASIGQLAAGVAHEINNPMGFITSNLSTLQKYLERMNGYIQQLQSVLQQSATEEQLLQLEQYRQQTKIVRILEDSGQLVQESLEGADRVKHIVSDLKNFARTDQNLLKQLQMNPCIETALNLVRNEYKYCAELQLELQEDLQELIGNSQQLVQVISNLVVNAAHAISGQGTITIRSWQEETAVCFAISDTGCGMPEEVQRRIFEPFYTTKEVGKGTGLGLSISYDIIKKHGGEITVESEVGRGTTFTVRLPIEVQNLNTETQ